MTEFPGDNLKPFVTSDHIKGVGVELQHSGGHQRSCEKMGSVALSSVQIECRVAGLDLIKAQPVDEKANWTMSLQQSQWNETIAMTVHPQWTVFQLKKLIQVLNGVPFERQNLSYAGYSLHDVLLVSNSGMFDGCTVKLAIKLSAKNKQADLSESLINITVKTMKGSKIELWVKPGWTVLQLQHSVEQVMGVPSHDQRLIFAGQQLESAFTLHDYGLKTGYVLYLLVRLTDR